MIDAINERGGIAIWESRLVAFLATADRFPHVVVVLSCRTTFLPTSCPTLTRKRCRALPILALPGGRRKQLSAISTSEESCAWQRRISRQSSKIPCSCAPRSDERRVGKECVSRGRSWRAPYN